MKWGRPTLYLPEYDQALFDHMAEGYTYQSFAGRIGVNIDTLYHWETLNPSFSEAKKAGREAQLFANEKRLHDIAKGKLKGNVVAQIFIMKNCHQWKDKHEVEIGDSKIQLLVEQQEKSL